jgi:hypothetical protein
MTPQTRIQAMKNLGVTVTPEMEEREYRISLDTVERTYGADWEATADALREQVELLDTLDWVGVESDAKKSYEYLDAKQAAQDCGCITCVSNLHNIETDNEANRRYFTDKLIADRHNAAKHTMKEVV